MREDQFHTPYEGLDTDQVLLRALAKMAARRCVDRLTRRRRRKPKKVSKKETVDDRP